jgi:hypothetical protein
VEPEGLAVEQGGGLATVNLLWPVVVQRDHCVRTSHKACPVAKCAGAAYSDADEFFRETLRSSEPRRPPHLRAVRSRNC